MLDKKTTKINFIRYLIYTEHTYSCDTNIQINANKLVDKISMKGHNFNDSQHRLYNQYQTLL